MFATPRYTWPTKNGTAISPDTGPKPPQSSRKKPLFAVLPLPPRVMSTLCTIRRANTNRERENMWRAIIGTHNANKIYPAEIHDSCLSAPSPKGRFVQQSRHHFSAAKGVPTLSVEDAKDTPLALTRGLHRCIPTTLQGVWQEEQQCWKQVYLLFLPGVETDAQLPSACGRLVLFAGELLLMVVKHVGRVLISPPASLFCLFARGSCLIDRVCGVFVQNNDCRSVCGAISFFRYFTNL